MDSKQKVLILGGSGMLGHMLVNNFNLDFDLWCTVRNKSEKLLHVLNIDKDKIIDKINVEDFDNLHNLIMEIKPDVVVNCIGVVKQVSDAKNINKSLLINSLLPNYLKLLSSLYSFRLIHISTDCVFSGNKGNYKEEDICDASDIYGKTKMLGEINQHNCLTLRTSFIGPEIETNNGLLNWFINNNNEEISGYKNALFSGFTSMELSKIIKRIIIDYKYINGIYHLSSYTISKFDLLNLINDIFNLRKNIIPLEEPFINRSLNSDKLKNILNFDFLPWDNMIEELYLYYK